MVNEQPIGCAHNDTHIIRLLYNQGNSIISDYLL